MGNSKFIADESTEREEVLNYVPPSASSSSAAAAASSASFLLTIVWGEVP
jgi:hypothetical protein